MVLQSWKNEDEIPIDPETSLTHTHLPVGMLKNILFPLQKNDLRKKTANWSELKTQTGSFHGKLIMNYIFIKSVATNM